MDEAMKRPPPAASAWLAPFCALTVALTLVLAAAPAAAQSLPDPTRPPPEAAVAPGETPAAPLSTGPQLQSVLVGEHGREVAVIDGQTVRVGDKIDGARLVRVGKDEAVLQRGATRVVLHLFPADAADGTKPGAPQR